jgi:hypothetical protein
MLVYVVAPRDSESGFDEIDSVILSDDKIAVGAKAFRCVKMTPEDAEKDPIVSDNGKEVPRFVLITPDYDYVKVVEGSHLGVSGMYSAMKTVAGKSYKTNFDRNVRALVKLLNEFDKIANERKLLEDKAGRNDKPSPADERKLAREREELDKREKEANEQRDSLLKFELREA